MFWLVGLILLLEATSQALLATSFAYRPTTSAFGELACPWNRKNMQQYTNNDNYIILYKFCWHKMFNYAVSKRTET